MKLGTIAINNLKRRLGKTIFLVAGLIIGIATIVTLFSITKAMELELGDTFDVIGANMLVVPESDDLTLSYGGVSIPGVEREKASLDMSAIDKIRTIPEANSIAIIAPKLLGALEVEDSRALTLGVQFENELRMKKWWKVNTSPTDPSQFEEHNFRVVVEKDQVVLGSSLANRLGVRPQDTITVQGEEYTIKGILQPLGAEEDNALLIDIEKMQGYLHQPGAVSLLEISALCNTCPIDDIVAQVADVLPGNRVTAIKEAVAARELIVERFSSFALAVSLVVLLIGSLVVSLTMLSSVNERTREIGIFRAIGFRKSHVMQIIFLEAILVSTLGGLIGYVLGMVIAQFAAPKIAQMDVYIGWSPLIALAATSVAILIGIGASIIPARKASNLDPSEALRYI